MTLQTPKDKIFYHIMFVHSTQTLYGRHNEQTHPNRKMVDKGGYFTINRGRQYGKTTTISLLEKSLST